MRTRRLSALEHQRQALADADAERGERRSGRRPKRSSWATRPTIRAPEAPSGCPIAIAPPRMLTFAGSSSGQPARQASDCDAKASFSSTTSTSSQPIPALASARLAASTGAIPKTSGSTPWTPRETTRASGSAPSRAAAASSPSSSIAAPSLSGELLPAVTVPSSTKAGFSLGQLLERAVGADPLVALEL